MKILVATGGSGGHIFPAVQAAKQLKARGHEVIFAGALAMAQTKIKDAGFEVIVIPAQGLGGFNPLKALRFMWVMLKAMITAQRLIHRIKPDKVIGFGGYGSFAVIAAAALSGYPSMIHEQNAVPGKANRLMARLVTAVALTFKSSASYFSSRQTVWTGCPCHCEVSGKSPEVLREKWQIAQGRRVIVLLGGSQGSHKLNEVFFEFIRLHGESLGLQAIHMTGKSDYSLYAAKYKAAGLPAMAYEFLSPMDEVYALADMMVSRAGAATISELGVLGIPSVLVPYPFAGNHQKYNADVLVDCGTAVMIEQGQLSVASLKEALEAIQPRFASREAARQANQDQFRDDAALQLALAVEAL